MCFLRSILFGTFFVTIWLSLFKLVWNHQPVYNIGCSHHTYLELIIQHKYIGMPGLVHPNSRYWSLQIVGLHRQMTPAHLCRSKANQCAVPAKIDARRFWNQLWDWYKEEPSTFFFRKQKMDLSWSYHDLSCVCKCFHNSSHFQSVFNICKGTGRALGCGCLGFGRSALGVARRRFQSQVRLEGIDLWSVMLFFVVSHRI